MKNVFLKYKPFTFETTIIINKNEANCINKLANVKSERLKIWLEQALIF